MIRLLYNYYEDKNPARKKEIDFCLQKNLENNHLNMVIIESAEKLTYDFFFNRINELTGPDDINIICNSDIFFDDTIRLASHLKHNASFALSRWDYINEHNIKLFDRCDSQDTWIVRGFIKHVKGDFTLGKKGCDNRIAYELLDAGYRPTNPSRSIKTYHVHNSNVRNYSHNDTVRGKYQTVQVVSLT
jgi:hypothetical protein